MYIKKRINTQSLLDISRSGFTIVELLIVIVVIGILAAITIVAYNGVQNRAKVATVSTDLAGAAKQFAVFEVDAGRYPTTLSEVNGGQGIKASSGTTYQYTGTGTTYCLTATNGTVSYKVSNASQAATQGGCPGHGVGGVAATTNFVLNPSFENNTTTSGGNISASGGSTSIQSSGGISGTRFMRSTFIDVTTLGWGQHSASVPVGTYAASFNIRSNIGIKFQPYLQGSATKTTIASSGIVTAPANTWTRAWMTVNVTATGTIQVGGYFVKDIAAPTTSDYIDFDGFMLTSGTDILNYADGNTANWIWNGTTNISTSTGPPV